MKRAGIRRLTALILITAVLMLSACSAVSPSSGSQTVVDMNGQLRVEDGRLVNEQGEPIQLRGMSSCDLISCYEFWTDEVCDTLIDDWGCTVIRLPVTVRSLDNGYVHFPDRYYEDLINYADTLINHGVYVIICWYNYFDGDPTEYESEAIDFFDQVSERYADCPNVIYEICNEPHGPRFDDPDLEVDWANTVKPYCETVIPVIRNNDPDNIIIVGTSDRNHDLDIAAADPLTGDNIMYALHFYAGSHGQEIRDKAQTAIDAGLPVFCTQWGVSLDTRDSGPFLDESMEWIEFLNDNNISWCNWSIGSRHTETSNVLRLYSDNFTMEQKLAGHWSDEMLSDSGIFVRSLIRGEEPTLDG